MIKNKKQLDQIVEESLRDAAIWDEVKDRLKKNALGMSGGQQQRLCIARALAVEPTVLLMDEPTSALDPISTSRIEDLAMELKEKYTIVMVTHDAFMASYSSRLIFIKDGSISSEFSFINFYETYGEDDPDNVHVMHMNIQKTGPEAGDSAMGGWIVSVEAEKSNLPETPLAVGFVRS